ncbi:MAG: hypothetical protein GF328_14995 [Candidatus Latescibacteria bacterium]|nr:hypothetical protein [Candidatus Latescibacterota bacterium]
MTAKKVDLYKEHKSEFAAGKSPAVKEVGLVTLDEGACVQMLHVDPYENERETLEQMEAFLEAEGYARRARHHEIYLSDPRRVAPEKLRTILRLPVAPPST